MNKACFILLTFIISFGVFFYQVSSAEAGLLSNFFSFFISGNNKKETESIAAISLPLLGSQAASAWASGSGGSIADEGGPALAVTQDSALVAPRNPIGTISNSTQDQILTYIVKGGDTPTSIAENFGISLNTLLWANNISNPRLIKPGDELIILPVTGVQYEVKKGDTLDSIAKQFKGDAGEISSFNGIAVDEPLQLGATIIIPDGELAPSLQPAIPSVKNSRFAGLQEIKGFFMRPIFGGRKTRGIHGYNGVDLAQNCGSSVVASAEGTVIIARTSGWNGGYGRYIVITHPNGVQTLYAHLLAIFASVGQRISQGSQIANIGSSGNSTGCHLHFEVRGAKNPF